MSGNDGVLRPEDISKFESFVEGDSGDFSGLLECIGNVIAEGLKESRFTEKQLHEDVEAAMWVSYACMNIGDYEHYYTACQWLSSVEKQASESGAWYYRYANSLMYCGKPRLAMEYLSRGIEKEPDYPWNYLTLGRLKAHYGDRDGATKLAQKGLELVPDDPEFIALLEGIRAGTPFEEMEMRFPEDPEMPGVGASEIFAGDGEGSSVRSEAIRGIFVDADSLSSIKKRLDPQGWIADHPYCTFMKEFGGKQCLVTLAMDEAYLSKMPVDRIVKILDSVPNMEKEARSLLKPEKSESPLYGVTINRSFGAMLSFGDETNGTSSIGFDADLKPIRPKIVGGPFMALVLLSDDSVDFDLIKERLSNRGIRCRQEPEGDNLVFEVDGNLAMYCMVHEPVPNGEAEESARSNYFWQEAVETASKHKAHILVALVNHDESAVRAATVHTQMVASACGLSNATGVYYQGSVVRPEDYIQAAGAIDEGKLPLEDWVWFGLYYDGDKTCGYTTGMSTLGKDEIEIIDSEMELAAVRDVLYDIAYHLIETESPLADGDEIELQGGNVFRITRSPGEAVDGESLKIEPVKKKR